MQLEAVLALFSLAALGAAENDVGAHDVPSACLPACQFTIDLSAHCEETTSDDDGYTPCVCGAQDSKQRLTECASCVKDHGKSDPDDNDVADLMDDCGWDFNNADAPYPTSFGTTTITSPSSTNAPGDGVVTVTETPPNATPAPGGSDTTTVVVSPGGDTTTVIVNPAGATNVPDSRAALNAKIVDGPLLAGLLISLPLMVG
ncbi:hypothetical protein F4777DRAFT_35915 [Nemania sp. FL0916]|nr:hypothetical protein F4777DRAFT_35915 [Nemania sp. FL0916]